MPEQILTEVVAGIAHRGRGVLLFDYDGTLAPLVDNPRHARMSLRMRRVIKGLLGRPGIADGILSGRSLGDLRQMVGIQGVCLTGLCGLELDFCGQILLHPEAASGRRLIAEVLCELRPCLQSWPQAWVEDKMLGATIHYRAVPQEATESLRTCVREVLDRFHGRVQVKQGPLAIEVMSALGRTKGTALRAILRRLPYRSPFVLYAGDSANDAEDFAEVLRLDGMTVGIGADFPDGPRHDLKDPSELACVLENLVGELKDIASRKGAEPPFCQSADAWRPFFPVGPM